MIVYVETNFIFELAFVREEHDRCTDLLNLAEEQKIELAVPAFSFGESYESWVRRARQRKALCDTLDRELLELARSQPYQDSSVEMQKLTSLLFLSGEQEKDRLDETISRLLRTATVIPLTTAVLQSSLPSQTRHDLSPQDAIVYASVLSHIRMLSGDAAAQVNCFITKNSKDFADQEIRWQLNQYGCKLLTNFQNGLGFVRSNLST